MTRDEIKRWKAMGVNPNAIRNINANRKTPITTQAVMDTIEEARQRNLAQRRQERRADPNYKPDLTAFNWGGRPDYRVVFQRSVKDPAKVRAAIICTADDTTFTTGPVVDEIDAEESKGEALRDAARKLGWKIL